MTHQNTATKEKVDKLDFIKIKASVLQKTLSRESKKDISQNGRKYLQTKQPTGINLQNIQTDPAAQYQKEKQPNQKLGGRSK